MKRKPNYLKHILQWGVLAAIAGTVLWANFSENPVDVEAYCPFGGLQAFGTYLVNNSLACSMSMLQIMMGLVLAVGVILFSKLFCGYLCPLGTVGEWMGRAGKKLHLQVEVPSGSIVDKLLRVVKYVLLFTILYFTLSSSELFCKKLDPFYAVATGFKGEIVLWMSLTSLTLLLLGGFVVKMFWCKYICPLGAVSNIFKFTLLFVIAALVWWKRPKAEASALNEQFFGAFRAGVRYARASRELHVVLLRAFVFFALASSVWALLPLVARQLLGGGADARGYVAGGHVGQDHGLHTRRVDQTLSVTNS